MLSADTKAWVIAYCCNAYEESNFVSAQRRQQEVEKAHKLLHPNRTVQVGWTTGEQTLLLSIKEHALRQQKL